MIRKLALASGVLAFGLLGVPLGAEANQITLLNSTAGGITLTGTGTLVNVSIAAGTGDGAVFQFGTTSELGTYSLGALTATAGPNVAEQYAFPAGTTETFNYTGADGDFLNGIITWAFIQDNTTNPKFFGALNVTSSGGDSAFTGTFPTGATGLKIDFTTTALPLFNGQPQTLDQLVAGSRTATVQVSSGELVPGPIVGAGLPGLVAACGGLLALVRRRRQQIA